MKASDLFIGLLLMVIGGSVSTYGLTLPPMTGQSYGAGLFPLLIGLCFVGFGARIGYQGWQERVATGANLFNMGDWTKERNLLINVFLVLALIIVYVALSERVGFAPLSLVILTILFVRFGEPWLRSVIVAVVATLFIQFSFSDILRVPLPRGVLDRILW